MNVNIFKMLFLHKLVGHSEIHDSHFHDIRIFAMLGNDYSKKIPFTYSSLLFGRWSFFYICLSYTYTNHIRNQDS